MINLITVLVLAATTPSQAALAEVAKRVDIVDYDTVSVVCRGSEVESLCEVQISKSGEAGTLVFEVKVQDK